MVARIHTAKTGVGSREVHVADTRLALDCFSQFLVVESYSSFTGSTSTSLFGTKAEEYYSHYC